MSYIVVDSKKIIEASERKIAFLEKSRDSTIESYLTNLIDQEEYFFNKKKQSWWRFWLKNKQFVRPSLEDKAQQLKLNSNIIYGWDDMDGWWKYQKYLRIKEKYDILEEKINKITMMATIAADVRLSKHDFELIFTNKI